MEPSKVLNYQFDETSLEYTEKDVSLYALAVGAASSNPCDPIELPLVYSSLLKDNFKVLPTFAVLLPASLIDQLLSLEGLVFDPKLLLHGEQYLELYQELPPRANVRSTSRISNLQDKGKAALLEVETISRDADTGKTLCLNRSTCFLRGAGGFSQSRPSTSSKVHSSQSTTKVPVFQVPPKGVPPHFTWEDKTLPSQALIYRLCGDYNPLHADPEFAAEAGFERPILHGLCTLGFASRAVIRCCCGGQPSAVKNLRARFLLHVFPGETLITDMWVDASSQSVTFTCKVKERQASVLTGSVGLLNHGQARL